MSRRYFSIRHRYPGVRSRITFHFSFPPIPPPLCVFFSTSTHNTHHCHTLYNILVHLPVHEKAREVTQATLNTTPSPSSSSSTTSRNQFLSLLSYPQWSYALNCIISSDSRGRGGSIADGRDIANNCFGTRDVFLVVCSDGSGRRG